MGKKFDIAIMNPPFSLGNEIVSTVKEYLTDDGKAVVIQPLNEYKKQNLFEHIETFELADPKIFNDAVITENLNISTVTKKKQNKFNWQELVLESCDQNFRKFYEWNIAHDRGIVMKRYDGKPVSYFDKNLDFVEAGRAFSKASGTGFGVNSIGYKWNNNINIGNNWIFNICCATFPSNKAKQNFVKYWYNGKKGKSLSSKVILGLHATNAGGVSYCIPQIDWETIDQHPLWSTDVDAAVLDTMGLKWDSNKEKIILK